jgi:ATP-dependent Clp protease ATP-binding subunit ClpA
MDKGAVTLGDNTNVDFSSAMVFLTSNLGAAEMSSLVGPKLGFHVPSLEDNGRSAKLSDRMSSVGTAAACRKFTPEFINRLDKIVVFNALSRDELVRIVDVEIERVQQRIDAAAAAEPFLIQLTDSAREFLPIEGADARYGARPLKRAIERVLVQALSNLIVTGQIHHHDCIGGTHIQESPSLIFFRESDAFEAEEAVAPLPHNTVREVPIPLLHNAIQEAAQREAA